MFGAKSIGCVVVVSFVAAASAAADVTISDKPTQNMSCDAGVCTPTASKAILNVTDLASMLASGDVTVNTGGSLAKDIDVAAALSWTSNSRLTLDSFRSVTAKKPVTVAGQGAVTIATNDGRSGGDLVLENKGKVTFWDLNSSLIINGNSYTLLGDIKTLAADIAENPSGFYALANDYDASADGTYTDSPVTTTLKGSFEGLGHAVSNVTIATQGILYTGFFAQIGSAGTVRDVALRHAHLSSNVSLTNSAVGGLTAENDGFLGRVSVDGSISGAIGLGAAAGGLVGIDRGTIANSNADVKLVVKSDVADVGGLVGFVDGTSSLAQVTDSVATGNTTGSTKSGIGGLVGSSDLGSIQRSRATGDVTSSGVSAVGGLIGGNGGSVDQSFATGSVHVGSSNHRGCYGSVGGLVGSNDSGITNSYATGSVNGGTDACVGGWVGRDTGSSAASYSLGHVSGGAGAQVGRFAGKFYKGFYKGASASDCYWDTDTSGTFDAAGNKSNVKGIEGLTTQQFQSGLPKGLDRRIWGEDPAINGGFPYLLANPPK